MSRQPILLDLFARAQGAAVGYARAGFRVTASDIAEYPTHPEVSAFIVADAMELLADVDFCRTFDVITASPPCQAYTVAPVAGRDSLPRLIGAVRARLDLIGRPYVIENVVSKAARAELASPITLCGSMFGLGATCRDGEYRQLRRHRYFDSNVRIVAPGPCQHQGQAGGVYGDGGGGQMSPGKGYKFHGGTIGVYGHGGTSPGQRGYAGDKAEATEAMGIDWMRRDDLSQAIPPAYTQHIGRQLLAYLNNTILEDAK
jgi:DNA (cytosine-5)-methyltransferase 1